MQQSRISGTFPEAVELTTESMCVRGTCKAPKINRPVFFRSARTTDGRTGPFTCHIIYSMLSSESQCLIVSVGEIKEKNKFKSCHVLVKTKEKRDEDTNEVIRQSGVFDCEVAIK